MMQDNNHLKQRLQHLLDRQEIYDCLVRYCRGVDRLDSELILSAYHPDAIDDHGMFVGSPQEFANFFINFHSSNINRVSPIRPGSSMIFGIFKNKVAQ